TRFSRDWSSDVCSSDLLHEAERRQIGDYALARFEAVQSTVGNGDLIVERSVRIEDVDQRQVAPLAELVIVEVVPGRDLHAARAELGIDVFIGDDRNEPVGERRAELRA